MKRLLLLSEGGKTLGRAIRCGGKKGKTDPQLKENSEAKKREPKKIVAVEKKGKEKETTTFRCPTSSRGEREEDIVNCITSAEM